VDKEINLVAHHDDHDESHEYPAGVHAGLVLTHDDHQENLAAKRDDPI